jgi:hypothetical protein
MKKLKSVVFTCNRCQCVGKGTEEDSYYKNNVAPWSHYMNKNEKIVCWECLYKNPRFLQDTKGKCPTFEETMLYIYNVKEL